MKRLWLGVILTAILLVAGIVIGSFMVHTGDTIAGILDNAADAALSGNFQTATALAEDAHNRWDTAWHWIAAAADHAPMDEIDSLFAQILVYADTGAEQEFAAHCKRISMLVSAVGEAHSFNWWNLL